VYEQRLRHRHLAGRLRIDTVTDWRPGHRIATATNRLRRTLERGAAALPERQRGLFLGVIIGDDRDEPADLVAAFRTSGLGHITAVSGQNVAFVIAAVGPLLRRLRLAPRLVSTLVLLTTFALLTRAEPSVLRATGMAAVAAYGSAVGRPSSGLRALGLTVTVLLLCDPLLVLSLGFRLSVAGAAGIVVAAAPLQRQLPGPEWLTTPIAVMLAAQLAVAPLLVGTFGTVALVSLPANLLAAPAVGPAMAWGLVAGFAGGVVGGRVAVLLQLPTRILLAWIEAVARTGARWPLAHLGARDLVVATTIGAAALIFRTWRQAPPLNCHTP
jgi:competence protein ComEC